MEENTIKNVVDFKYNDFEIGDEIEFGKWHKERGGEPAIWTVLKKIDFSNLNDDDNKWLKNNLRKPEDVKKAYDGKAIIVKMYDWTRVYFSCEYVKDESLDRGYYLNFCYENEWFEKERLSILLKEDPNLEPFPIVLNETENDLLIKENGNDGFISYNADIHCRDEFKDSDYLGKDLLFKKYKDNSKLLVFVGNGDGSDLDNWELDCDDYSDDFISNKMFEYSEDNLNFKTNSICYSRKKVGSDFNEEYTAFGKYYGDYSFEILDRVEECKENDCDIEEILSDSKDFNIIKLLIIKVKD